MKIQLSHSNHCPLCSRPIDYAPLYRLSRFNVYQCPCAHRFIDPSLSSEAMMRIYQSSEDLAAINPVLEQYYEYELTPRTKTYRDYMRMLDFVSHITPGRSLLEVGCGTGEFLKLARTHGWRVTGVDSGEKNLRELTQEGIGAVACDFMKFETRERFDVVCMLDLIEHTQNPVAFTQKAGELLKPEGVLLMASPCEPNLLSMMAGWLYRASGEKVCWPLEWFYVSEHTSYFSERSFRVLLGKSRFELFKSWKTEADLKRYHFSALFRAVLTGLFFLARGIGLQNRIVIVAKKSPPPYGKKD